MHGGVREIMLDFMFHRITEGTELVRDAADENGRPGLHGKSVRGCSVRKITASQPNGL
jgi:hypothetical protein